MSIIKEDNNLILCVELNDDFFYQENFRNKLNNYQSVKLYNTFRLNATFLIRQETIDYFENYFFKIGEIVDDNFYLIDKRIFETKNNFLFQKNMEIDIDYFIAPNSISILRHIDNLIAHDVIIGNSTDSNIFNIPEAEYINLLESFPTTYELQKYRQKRVAGSIADFVDLKKDANQTYLNYLNKKLHKRNDVTLNKLFDFEENKYRIIYDKLSNMLLHEANYKESDWQKEIIKIILIIYPKYLAVGEKIYFNTRKGKRKFLDLCLVDYTGKVDIIEIKKPYNIPIFSRSTYRDNYFPSREISGTIMQLEKYIYHLDKLSQQQIESMKKRYFKDYDFEFDMISPKGFIIAGRTKNFTSEQIHDFEILKRKYSNIIDFLSYDDLLARIKSILQKFEKL
ncbi:hypothetical protein HNP38_003514 [Chryseobacterium defluvii]|uniref:Shedu protein SduA C-terminal domain-containing protein n=1 Tax=Chryseobacterium defluvii TaxID=160396 RepID=A0A840KKJ3_9FLAO|nr:Shedu immune nuclease family protein [Chryseobacterium defluvii]MBB4808174.1 hypothetical protein [Chryseobacterium defluvii]